MKLREAGELGQRGRAGAIVAGGNEEQDPAAGKVGEAAKGDACFVPELELRTAGRFVAYAVEGGEFKRFGSCVAEAVRFDGHAGGRGDQCAVSSIDGEGVFRMEVVGRDGSGVRFVGSE